MIIFGQEQHLFRGYEIFIRCIYISYTYSYTYVVISSGIFLHNIKTVMKMHI